MGLDDRIKNSAEQLGGKAKEAFGSMTGNEEAQAEGRAEQVRGEMGNRFEDVKDNARGAADDLKNKFQ